MSARALVLLGASPWEGSVVAGLTHPASRVEIVRRCVDTADLLAASAAGLGQVAVIGADAPRLDSDVLARVQDSGLALIALINRGDERARDLMTSWGADVIVDIDPQELGKGVGELISSVHQLADHGRSVAKFEDEGHEDVLHAGGRVICVWGPAGAPGRTTVAHNSDRRRYVGSVDLPCPRPCRRWGGPCLGLSSCSHRCARCA